MVGIIAQKTEQKMNLLSFVKFCEQVRIFAPLCGIRSKTSLPALH